MKLALKLMTVLGAFAFAAPASASWTGCYVGGHAGMAMVNTTTGLENLKATKGNPAGTVLETEGLGATGTAFGVGVGCDYQMARMVFGAFADMDWYDADWSLTSPTTGFISAGFGIDKAWTVGGRVGVLLSNSTLAYGLIGWSQLDMTPATLTVGLLTASAPLGSTDGMVVGGGIETEIIKSVRLKLEYRYAMYDDIKVPVNAATQLSFEPEVHTVRLGISYLFNLGGSD